MSTFRSLFLLFFLFCAHVLYAQKPSITPVPVQPLPPPQPIVQPVPFVRPATDSMKKIEILQGVQRMGWKKIDSLTELQTLAGNVRIRQGTTFFSCDSCVINQRTRVFEAFGKVHINDADTAHVYSDYLQYFIDKRLAFLKRNVKMTDGKGELTTNDLEYDVSTKIGIYRNGGKVVNGKTTLTSKEGYYYSDIHDVYFKKSVDLKDPAYVLKTDSLLYNTETEIARFMAQTFVRDSSGRTLITKEGFYDLKHKRTELGSNPVIQDKSLIITGKDIISNDSTGMTIITNNAVIRDTAEGRTVMAGQIFIDNKNESFLAIRKPVMIIKQDNDTIYLAADTLFSAKLTDLYKAIDTAAAKDTLKGVQVLNLDKVKNKDAKDSSNRYFEAFRNVRIFNDSLQARSDSLFYSLKDSVFRLFQNPVVWTNKSQIKGDTIYLFTKNKKADRLQVFENSLLINEVQPEIYNQVKSTRMDGYFIEGNIDSVRAKGSAETIYYIQDQDSAFLGINQSTCDILDIYFASQELRKVVFRSTVKGTMWPMRQKTPQEMRLTNFQWLEDRRPKTKFELFE